MLNKKRILEIFLIVILFVIILNLKTNPASLYNYDNNYQTGYGEGLNLWITKVYAMQIVADNGEEGIKTPLVQNKPTSIVVIPGISREKEPARVNVKVTWYEHDSKNKRTITTQVVLYRIGDITYAFPGAISKNQLNRELKNPDAEKFKRNGWDKIIFGKTISTAFTPSKIGINKIQGFIDSTESIRETSEDDNINFGLTNIQKTNEHYKIAYTYLKTKYNNYRPPTKTSLLKIKSNIEKLAYTLPIYKPKKISLLKPITLQKDLELTGSISIPKTIEAGEAESESLIIELSQPKYCPEEYNRCIFIVPEGSLGLGVKGRAIIPGKDRITKNWKFFRAVLVTENSGLDTYMHEIGHSYGAEHDKDDASASEGIDHTNSLFPGYQYKAYNTIHKSVMTPERSYVSEWPTNHLWQLEFKKIKNGESEDITNI